MPNGPDRLTIEFLVDYLNQPDLRCKVLRAERDGLADWGLNADQIDDLVSLQKNRILKRIADELKARGADVDKAYEDIYGPGSIPEVAAAMMYTQGEVHIREVEPAAIPSGSPQRVELRGQGFAAPGDLSVEFRSAQHGTVTATVESLRCDVDVRQYVTVSVELSGTGPWEIFAKSAGDADWGKPYTVQAV